MFGAAPLASLQIAPLPDGNPKTAQGVKKPPVLSVVPASALLQVGAVMRLGKAKYGPFNWRDEGITASTYIDAAFRHLASWWDGESNDPESGASHVAHAVAGLLILLDAQSVGTLTDDRPAPGKSAALIARFAEKQSFD